MTRQPRFWGFRTDTSIPRKYYNEQLKKHGVLRQGWGWDESQDLRKMPTEQDIPREQRANFRMYRDVRKGDFILVPRLPEWEQVTIAEAVEDWETGYRFEIDDVDTGDGTRRRDYGHKFPAKCRAHFSRNNEHVDGVIRQTLKCRSRFWNMDRCSESIQKIVEIAKDRQDELIADEDREDRFRRNVREVMQGAGLGEGLHKALSKEYANSGWEYALVAGLKNLFPCYQVERTGGRKEKQHGTDILIAMPGPLDDVQYGIAIQVKDWQGDPTNIEDAITQIRKADEFSKERQGLRIVEKIVVLTEADYTKSLHDDVTVIDRHGLKELLRRMALATAAALDE